MLLMLLAMQGQGSLLLLPQMHPQLRGPVGVSLLLEAVQSSSLGVTTLFSTHMKAERSVQDRGQRSA